MTRTLDLCGAGRGRSCVLLHDGSTPAVTLTAARLAARRTGASVTLVEGDGGDDPVREGPALAACRAADLVVDLGAAAHGDDAPDGLAGSDGRLLRIGPLDASQLVGFVSHPGIERRVRDAVSTLGTARSTTVVSAGQTALTLAMGDAEVSGGWGVAGGAGTTARWPGGLVEIRPGALGDGALAVMAGDVVMPARRLVVAPATVVVEAGHVCEVSGSDDAALIRALFETAPAATHGPGGDGDGDGDGDSAYRLASVRIGMNPTAPLDPHVLFVPALADPGGDVRRGVVTVAFGAGGVAPAVEIRLRRATVVVDEVTVVADGLLVGSFEPDVYEELGRRSR